MAFVKIRLALVLFGMRNKRSNFYRAGNQHNAYVPNRNRAHAV